MATGRDSSEARLSLLLLIVAASQRSAQVVERELAVEGVDVSDYALLSLVGVRRQSRLTELAAELGMPLTTASDAIRRLESRGHVERLANPDDGRSSLFRLSRAGTRVWKRGWPALRRLEEELAVALRDAGSTRAMLEELGDVLEAVLTKK